MLSCCISARSLESDRFCLSGISPKENANYSFRTSADRDLWSKRMSSILGSGHARLEGKELEMEIFYFAAFF